MNILKGEAGQVLPMALILLVLGGLLVVPTLSLMTTNLTANRTVDQSNLRLYAADAGVQYAYYKFANDVDFNPGTDPLEFPPGSDINGCAVTLDKQYVDDLTYRITSVAHDTAIDKNTTVIAYFRANQAQYETGPSAFDYAVATLDGNLTMTGSSTISSDCSPEPCSEGNVWVNGNIILGWSNIIDGDATVTGTCNRPGNIEGVYDPGSEPPERPAWLDDQVTCYIADTTMAAPITYETYGTTYGGNWNLSAGTYASNGLKVNGNMTIGGSGNYYFNGPVWVTGNLVIQSGVNHVYFKKSVQVDGYVELGGNGTVTFCEDAATPDWTIVQSTHGIGTSQGSAINVIGYSPVRVSLSADTCGYSGSVDVTLQDSNDGSTWTDVASCRAFSRVTEANDNTTYEKNYAGGKNYLRAVATISGATCNFGVSVVKKPNNLYIGKYLYCAGSRSARFKGQVDVRGAAKYSKNYIVSFDGSKYSGVAWDVEFYKTIRATETDPSKCYKMKFASGRSYTFYDAVYTTETVELAGNTGCNMTFTKALIADCNILTSGSSNVDAPPTTSPIFVSRYGDVSLTGDVRVDAIVYAPEGEVNVSNSSQLEGAIVAKSALLEGNIRLKYPVVLRERYDIQPPEQGGPSQGESIFSIVSYSIQ